MCKIKQTSLTQRRAVHVPPGIRTLAIDAEGQVAVRAQAQVGEPHRREGRRCIGQWRLCPSGCERGGRRRRRCISRRDTHTGTCR
jgi:hypothetical protein